MKFIIRIAICLLLIGAGAAAMYYLYIGKTLRHDAELVKATEDRERALSDLEHSTSGVEDVTRKIAELKQAIQFFESKLPQEKEVDTILREVWQIAEANSLQTRTIRSGKQERGANYSEQSIEMNLSGDFNGFYAFLLQLEKLSRLTRVTQMSLTKISEHDGEMQAQVTLNIFFEPSTNAAATAKAL